MTSNTSNTTRPCTAPTAEQLATALAQDATPRGGLLFQHQGELFMLAIEHDPDAHPLDYLDDATPYDPTNPAHKARRLNRRYAAWRRDEWHYIGLFVQLARRPELHASLWGIESDSGAQHLEQIMGELCSELLHLDGHTLAPDEAA